MIQVTIIGNRFKHYQNEQIIVPAAKAGTIRQCLDGLPPEYGEIKREIIENLGKAGWSLMLEGELLDPKTDLDLPVQGGEKLYIFCHMQPGEIIGGVNENQPKRKNTARRDLHQILAHETFLVSPGVYNVLTAKLAEAQGYKCVFVTADGVTSSLIGSPSSKFTSRTVMLEVTRLIVEAVKVPVIVEIDNPSQGVRNLGQAAREFENTGAAGILIDDKETGGFNSIDGKPTAPRERMVEKIGVIKRAVGDPRLFLIAQTGSIESVGFEEAVSRSRRYLEAGADMVSFKAAKDLEQVRRLPKLVNGFLSYTVGEDQSGSLLTIKELPQLGYRMAIFPDTALLAAITAVNQCFQGIISGRLG